jgi:hypothetical protein
VNSAQAKTVLIACRPGTDDLRTPEADAALELARRDPELRAWWKAQQAFHNQVRADLAGIEVPPDLRDRILSRAKVVKLPVWRHPAALSAAAAIVLLLTAVAVWKAPSSAENSFETFRSRMVRNVLRQYRMDITTSDMTQVRQFLATNNAPANFVLPPKVNELPVMGAGLLSWRDRRVSMVCLNGGTNGTVFVFIVDSRALSHAPRQRELAQVSELNTASWSEAGKTYVVAGPEIN